MMSEDVMQLPNSLVATAGNTRPGADPGDLKNEVYRHAESPSERHFSLEFHWGSPRSVPTWACP